MRKKISFSKIAFYIIFALIACCAVSCDDVGIVAPQNRAEQTTLKVLQIGRARGDENGKDDEDDHQRRIVRVALKTDPHAKVFYQIGQSFNFDKGSNEDKENTLRIYSQTADDKGYLIIEIDARYTGSSWEKRINIWALAEGKVYSPNIVFALWEGIPV